MRGNEQTLLYCIVRTQLGGVGGGDMDREAASEDVGLMCCVACFLAGMTLHPN